jgi:membrane-bound lytic murein transglycosylase D
MSSEQDRYCYKLLTRVNASGQPTDVVPALNIRIEISPGEQRTFQFRRAFRIGRLDDCDVYIDNDYVSRTHAEISFENGKWWVCDLGSSNGIYLGDQRVVRTAIEQPVTIRLGIYGPEVCLEPEPFAGRQKAEVGSETMVARYIEHYFDGTANDPSVGQHTMYVRRAFAHVQSKEKRKYGKIIMALALVMIAAASYAVYEHRQVRKQKAMAEDLFYTMKSLDLDVANLERLVADSHSQLGIEQIRKYRSRREELEKSYDSFLATLHVYDPKMPEQNRLILRVARIFGESELEMPPGFSEEVKNYIKKWQSSPRFATAVQIAKEKGYTTTIPEEMLAQALPPQFFYLAMQESNFDPYASGPVTRKGYAKGMWQFVPETAVKYGLHLGPLVDLRRPDPGDERDHYEKATKAAAAYLKDLYSTDAQASGLLVIACYNWGENQMLPLVRSMPPNPRERNFWKLLANHRRNIPQETYDYVFYIVSAAVIGENPRLFGFNFDNPLSGQQGK